MALQRELRRRSGVLVPLDAFDLDKLPAHLRVTFAVESADGTEVARGKDLDALQERLAGRARRAVAEAVADGLERTGLRGWPDDLDELPRTVERPGSSGQTVRGFPALVDTGTAVDLAVFATAAEQDAAMGPGIRRLLRLSVGSPVKALERGLDPRRRLALGANPDGSLGALLDDCADAAVGPAGAGTGVDPRRVHRAGRPGGGRAAGGHRRHRRAGGKGAGGRPPGRAGAPGRPAARAGRVRRRHPRAPGPAAAEPFRRRDRRRAPHRSHPLPHRHLPTPGPIAARGGRRPGTDGPRARGAGRLRRAGVGVVAAAGRRGRRPRHRAG